MRENKECMVCLTDFTYDANTRTTTCMHIFHDECLESWLK